MKFTTTTSLKSGFTIKVTGLDQEIVKNLERHVWHLNVEEHEGLIGTFISSEAGGTLFYVERKSKSAEEIDGIVKTLETMLTDRFR